MIEKSLRGGHRTKRGPLEKKFIETCFYEFKMIVLMRENVFDGFKAIWSLIKNFQNWPKKSLRGDHRTKGGPLEKNFSKRVSMSLKWLFSWKKTFLICGALWDNASRLLLVLFPARIEWTLDKTHFRRTVCKATSLSFVASNMHLNRFLKRDRWSKFDWKYA